MSFKRFFEETTSADIATVDNKLDLTRRHEKYTHRGKRCKIHKEYDCEECEKIKSKKFD